MAVDNPDAQKISGPSVTVAESYRRCRQAMRVRLATDRWVGLNLGAEEKQHLFAVMALACRVHDLCSIHMGKTARQDQLDELKDELHDNLMRRQATGEFPALVDTVEKFDIPKQYAFDMLSAADLCIRLDGFDEFDQWLVFGCRLGGSATLMACSILGVEKPGFENAAIAVGQAIQLTHLLATIGTEIQLLEFFLPQSSVAEFEVELDKLNPARPDKSVLQMIRYLVTQIESIFADAGHLVEYLTFDGRRAAGALISVYWHLLMKIKRNPGELLSHPMQLTSQERFHFLMRHLMGFKGAAPVLPEVHEH